MVKGLKKIQAGSSSIQGVLPLARFIAEEYFRAFTTCMGCRQKGSFAHGPAGPKDCSRGLFRVTGVRSAFGSLAGMLVFHTIATAACGIITTRVAAQVANTRHRTGGGANFLFYVALLRFGNIPHGLSLLYTATALVFGAAAAFL